MGAGGTEDFDPTTGTAPLTSHASRDIFVWKLTQPGLSPAVAGLLTQPGLAPAVAGPAASYSTVSVAPAAPYLADRSVWPAEVGPRRRRLLFADWLADATTSDMG